MENQFDLETELIFASLLENADEKHPVYVVGGIVRDILLHQNIHDIDVSYCGNVRAFAKSVADSLGAKFFMLNEEFQTARIIYSSKTNRKRWIDVIATRENQIEKDLFLRDFTVNSMAIDLNNRNVIIDPFGGALDLQQKIIKITNPNSIPDDPVRILRAIRLAVQFGWKISTETKNSIRSNSEMLKLVTNERKRDELFKILELPNPTIALRIMKQLDLEKLCFPGISAISNFQSSEVKNDSFNFSIEMIEKFVEIEALVIARKKYKVAINVFQADLLLTLGCFRNDLIKYFQINLHQDRNLRSLFILNLIYSNPNNLLAKQINEPDHFHNDQNAIHNNQNLEFRRLVLTNNELKWLNLLRNNILHFDNSINNRILNSPEFAFDFFNRTKNSGVAICFYFLAHQLIASKLDYSNSTWKLYLSGIRYLIDAYFNHFHEWVEPPGFVDGHDIRKVLNMKDGKLIGDLLNQIKRKTVRGEINNRQEAIDFLKSNYKNS